MDWSPGRVKKEIYRIRSIFREGAGEGSKELSFLGHIHLRLSLSLSPHQTSHHTKYPMSKTFQINFQILIRNEGGREGRVGGGGTADREIFYLLRRWGDSTLGRDRRPPRRVMLGKFVGKSFRFSCRTVLYVERKNTYLDGRINSI